ncbi:MAG: hypothetical protein HZA31_01890 [Opitutae bacterium]|nr:hypothetical protein [Opitutae bacterium]
MIALAGCASAKKEAKTEFAGYYAMVKGGFNESMSVELARDGSYVLDHELFACVIGPNGEMPITYSREEGTWKFEGGVIILEPTARTKDFPDATVFVPSLAHRLLPKRDGFSRLLVNVDHPEGFVMKKTKKADPAGTDNSGAAPRRV